MRFRIILPVCLILVGNNCFADSIGLKDDMGNMIFIEGGVYKRLYKESGVANLAEVGSFYMDKFQVTNGDFFEFIKHHPEWQPQNISKLFSDDLYLSHLSVPLGPDQKSQPVTNVSWYAAMAYCKSQGKTLPDIDQWEYVGRASKSSANGLKEPMFKQKILEWYARPATDKLPSVESTESNWWGVHGMHGVVWEQVKDFNSILVTGESRGDSVLDKRLFCGSGAASAVDPGDYGAFMRYALRGSYAATYALSSLGFRCARNR